MYLNKSLLGNLIRTAYRDVSGISWRLLYGARIVNLIRLPNRGFKGGEDIGGNCRWGEIIIEKDLGASRGRVDEGVGMVA